MQVANIVEISSESSKNFSDAVIKGIAAAEKTIRHVHGAWIGDQQVVVEEGKPPLFRVSLRVSYILE